MSQHRSGLGLELSCVVDAPRARVFDLLTKPDELAKWWGPRGFTIPEVGVDLRVGGGYRFTMQPPEGEVFHLSGRFLEIEPSRLRYTFTWDEPHPDDRETVVMLELRAVGDTTEVSMSQGHFKTEERLLLHRDGWTDALAKLRELAPTTDLPFVDEHRIRISAPRDHVWRVLRHYVDSSLGVAKRSPVAWLLGTQPRAGFEVEREIPGEQVDMAGRHRFSHYRLVFELVDAADNETQLSARTYAEFPGLRGRVYRALVIGTRLHVLATNQILRSVRRAALG